MSELVFQRGAEELMRVVLDRPQLVVGNGAWDGPCHISLPDPAIAPRQCLIEQRGTRYVLVDASGAGTRVDGEPRTEYELQEGSKLSLGRYEVTFRGSAGGAANSPSDTAILPEEPIPRLGPVQLRIRSGAEEQIVPLTSDELSLGKDSENQLVLADPFISSFHIQISRQRQGFWLRDLGSTNGTFLNGARIREAELPLGGQVRVGETVLTLESVGTPPSLALTTGIIGRDPALRQILELIDRVAPHTAAVAIFGETGTGKELVARAIHARSPRHAGPFVPLNCAALHGELIESELFGHEKGAFTGAHRRRPGAFETASGGTLFLDEVVELSLEGQAKLLRVLESGEIQRLGASEPTQVDVRVITATNQDLAARVRARRFREDLFYRLCVFPLNLPPLRRRPGDLDLLTDHFVDRFRPSAAPIVVAPETRAKLAGHAFHGNVRELRSLVQRALVNRTGATLLPEHIVFDPLMIAERSDDEDRPDDDVSLRLPGRTEREIIDEARKRAIRRHDGNKTRAAEELGINRSTLTPIDAGPKHRSD